MILLFFFFNFAKMFSVMIYNHFLVCLRFAFFLFLSKKKNRNLITVHKHHLKISMNTTRHSPKSNKLKFDSKVFFSLRELKAKAEAKNVFS